MLGAVATGTVLVATGYTPLQQGIGRFGLAVGLGTLVALLPDVDTRHSQFRRVLGLDSGRLYKALQQEDDLPLMLLNLLRLPFAWLLDFVAWLLPHRGPTHWLIVALLLIGGFYYLTVQQGWPPLYWVAFTTGYLSHLLADSCTKAGVKLGAPFWQGAVHLLPRPLRIRTGGAGEVVGLLVLLTPFLAWLVSRTPWLREALQGAAAYLLPLLQ